MRNRVFWITLLLISFSLNIYLLAKKDINSKKHKIITEDQRICKEKFHSPRYDNAFLFPYETSSLDGTPIKMYTVKIRGSIKKSIKEKYGETPSLKLIRNIQKLVMALQNFKLRFSRNDRISLFFSPATNTIYYLRYKSYRKTSIFEAFLDSFHSYTYVTGEGTKLFPCFKTGPFKGCHRINVVSKDGNLIPVFLFPKPKEVTFPYDGWVSETNVTSLFGGEVRIFVPKKGMTFDFFMLAHISKKIKPGHRIYAGTRIGKGGYYSENGIYGVGYYLLQQDGTTLSPFLFHHVERPIIYKENNNNFKILTSFYRRLFVKGVRYENNQ